MTEKRKRALSDLPLDPIDDRWTESKLLAEGYEYNGDGACRTCGETVSFYKKVRGYSQPVLWMILDEGSLGLHQCRGRK